MILNVVGVGLWLIFGAGVWVWLPTVERTRQPPVGVFRLSDSSPSSRFCLLGSPRCLSFPIERPTFLMSGCSMTSPSGFLPCQVRRPR